MTGFGQAVRSALGYRLQIEIKSVNHRYAECMLRLPREWFSLEDMLKKVVLQAVKRGRLEVVISIQQENEAAISLELDWPLVEAYTRAAEKLKAQLNLTDSLTLQNLLQIPELFKVTLPLTTINDELVNDLLLCLKDALNELMEMKETEGRFLQIELQQKLLLLKSLLELIKNCAPQAAEAYRDKLRLRMQELLTAIPIDEQRILQEVALFADRSNIDEEITRLQSHFIQFLGLLAGDVPTGRKLDFLLQEINREVNTIGSKANYAEIVNHVVQMKAELEKIREQVQNIE